MSTFTVIVSGDKLGIEFRDQVERAKIDVVSGTGVWDEPEERLHRAVNIGSVDYVEIVTFYRENASIVPQPKYL